MARQTWIVETLRTAGVPVVTLHGWAQRGSAWFTPKGVVWHHTATGPDWQDLQVARLLRDGRRGLPGPLAQFGVERDGTWVVVAAGRANHAGRGGWRGLAGNRNVFGVEAYNSGRGEPWPQPQYRSMVIGTAALLGRHHRDPFRTLCGHKEWAPSRKIDPKGIDMPQARRHVAAEMAGRPWIAPSSSSDWTGALVKQLPTLQLKDPYLRGRDVKRLQGLLVANGAAPARTIRPDGSLDGVHGAGTDAAVRRFQRAAGLKVDGVVGQGTWTALLTR